MDLLYNSIKPKTINETFQGKNFCGFRGCAINCKNFKTGARLVS